jgi:hypothetical protein
MRFNLSSLAIVLAVVACGPSQKTAAPPVTDQPATDAPDDKQAAQDTPAPAETAAPTPTPAPAPPVEPEAAPIVVGALKMTMQEKGKPAESIDVAADGTVKRQKDGKIVGKFVKNEIHDGDGKWLVRVKHDGTIEMRSVFREMKDGKVVKEEEKVEAIGKFVAGDAIEGPKGKVVLADDGAITVTKPDGKSEPVKELKLQGVKPETRRAGLLLFVAMMSGTATVDSSAATAEPATPPAPPKAPTK